ncbi:MAG: sensor histidine kinase [Nitrososphaerales archaeon]
MSKAMLRASSQSNRGIFIKTRGRVVAYVASLIERTNGGNVATSGAYSSPEIDIMTDGAGGPLELDTLLDSIGKAMRRNPNFSVRIATNIHRENIGHITKAASLGIDVRHIAGVKRNFVVTGNEYVEVIRSRGEEEEERRRRPASPFSNELSVSSIDLDVISQVSNAFQLLWEIGISAESRLKELEEGRGFEETKIISDPNEARKVFFELAKQSKKEIFLIVSSEVMLRDGIEVIGQRVAESKHGGIEDDDENGRLKVRMLISSDANENKTLHHSMEGISWRKMTSSTNVSFGIFDGSQAFIIAAGELKSDKGEEEEKQQQQITSQVGSKSADAETSMQSGLLLRNKETIFALQSIFEAAWQEWEIREKESRSRRQALLLQDILTHDIRNYNQIAKLSAELLREELKDNEGIKDLTDSLLKSIEGSTALVERAKRLGKIISQTNPTLYPVNLADSIGRALSLVKQNFSQKSFEIIRSGLHEKNQRGGGAGAEEGRMDEERQESLQACVFADDLLDEIFTNLLANSVKYTKGELVRIEIALTEAGREWNINENEGGGGNKNSESVTGKREGRYWKLTISDHGTGIQDDQHLFTRYSEGAKGSGLGLSIVHALAVERYKGNVRITNRKDCQSGAVAEVWLPKAIS